MIEPISSLKVNDVNSASDRQTSFDVAATSAQEQFLVLFYKELLSNTMKMPNLNGENDQENATSSFSSTFTSDLMAEKLAQELAKKQLIQRKLINTNDD